MPARAERARRVPEGFIILHLEPGRETIVDTTKAEVFYDLKGLRGEPVGHQVMEDMFQHTTIEEVDVLGEPAANKSTAREQGAGQVLLLSGGIIAVDSEPTFDDVLEETAQEVGSHYSEWWPDHPEYWHRFSDNLYTRLNQRAPGLAGNSKRRVLRWGEAVCLAGRNGRDRAVSTLERLAQDIRAEDPDNPKRRLVAIAPDVRSQRRAGKMRDKILKTPDGEVFKVLTTEFFTEPVGVSDTPEGGRLIKEILEKTAPGDRIMAISDELLLEAISWYKEYDGAGALVNRVVLPQEAYSGPDAMTSWEQFHYKLKAAHLDWRLHIQLGLSEKQARVALSPFRSKKIVHRSFVNPTLINSR